MLKHSHELRPVMAHFNTSGPRRGKNHLMRGEGLAGRVPPIGLPPGMPDPAVAGRPNLMYNNIGHR